MGIFGNIGNVLKSAALSNYNPLNVLSAAFAQPVNFVKNPIKTIEAVKAAPAAKNVIGTITTTAIAAGAILTGGAIASGASAGTLGASAAKLIPTTIKGKVIAAVVAPIALGAVVSQPAKVLSAAVNAPSSLANVGGNVANLISNPSLANVKTIFKENPVTASALAAGAVAAAGLATAGIAASVLNTQAARANTKAEQENSAIMQTGGGSSPSTNTGSVLPTGGASAIPVTPATQTLEAGNRTSTTRRKRSSKASNPIVSNRINVMVSNRSSSTGIRATKRYLNREVLMS